jgi:Transposase DDE domain group 1
MSWNFKRSRRPQQANLKLKGQKLFNIDDGAGQLSSFGGLLPLAKLAEDSGLLKMAASLIPEWRKDDAVVFPVDLQLAQRVFLTACGQPDAIDCTFFKDDPALTYIFAKQLQGQSMPGQSTSTRMEQNISTATMNLLEQVPLRFFMQQKKNVPRQLTIYVDGTAIRTFGSQQQSTWRGGYAQTQYFPLIATTAQGDLLLAKLRGGGHHDSKSSSDIVKLINDIRAKWTNVFITLVMDTGFNSPGFLKQLEQLNVKYVIGYPARSSAKSKIKHVIKAVEKDFRKRFGEPRYVGKARKKDWQIEHDRIRQLPTAERVAAEKLAASRYSRIVYGLKHNGTKWDRDRDLISRVDFTDKGLDIRCIVTNVRGSTATSLYEDKYCLRSRVEMFIKETKSHCKVPLSCQSFTANQFRFTTIQGLTYMLLHGMRQSLPPSQKQISLRTLRDKFLLIPVNIIETAKRVLWRLSSLHPNSQSLVQLCNKLQSRTA